MIDLTELGVAALRDGVRTGKFSAREVADQFIVKVSKAKALNAFIVETPTTPSPPRALPMRRWPAASRSSRWPACRSG